MTELDLYLKCIFMIVGMVEKCRKLSSQQFEEWKSRTINSAPETVKEFLEKVFIVISLELERERKEGAADER